MMIGNKIRELRQEKNLFQRELAEIIHIAPNTLSQFENGKSNPSYEVLIAFADYFECTTDYILGRSDDFGNVQVLSTAPKLSNDEERLLATFRKLSFKDKAHVQAYADVRLEESKNALTKRA